MELDQYLHGRGPPADENYRWYHIILTTYGAWLHGDERGFRTRGHREHVEGDYLNPPPMEKYAARKHRSQRLLKQPPVMIPKNMRPIVGFALTERLFDLGGFVLRVAVAGQHVHLIVKLPRGRARDWSGVAKRHAWFELRDEGWNGKLWGKRGKAIPIRSHDHQRSLFRYIGRHAEQGAWVWTWQRPQEEIN